VKGFDKEHLQVHAFEGCIAFACALASFLFFTAFDVVQSPVGELLKPWQYAWNTMFGLSGVLMFVGLAFPRNKFWRFQGVALELCGLVFLIAAMLVNTVCSIYVLGVTPGMATIVAVLVAALMRIRTITASSKRLAAVELPGDD
jgi:hypothetical protein